MAKKKPGQNSADKRPGEKKKTENGEADKAPGRADTRIKHISRLVLVTTGPGQTEGSQETVSDTWASIVNNLRAWQTAQKGEKGIEKDHSADYDFEAIEAEYNAKNKTYRDELQNNGRGGRDDRTRAAKRQMVEAEKAYKEAKKNREKNSRFDKANRRLEHDQMTRAQEVLEDWLFYQDASRRRIRRRDLDSSQRRQVESERLGRKMQYLLDPSSDDYGHFDWLHSLLDLYDSRDIGGQSYTQGWKDHLGNQITKKGGDKATLPRVGPRELHLWTPAYRRRLVGLRRPEEDTDSDDYDAIEPDRFELDEAAVEAERMKTEKKIDRKTKDLVYSSHDARRRDEIRTYKNSRPNTSNVREATVDGTSIVQDRWGHIRTKQGLFIAARESSWDWLTSYDCLGPVKSGWYPETSAVRDDPEVWIEADDLDSGSDSDSQVDAPRASRDQPTKNDENALGEPVGESRKAGKATINYPYPAREFWRDSKPFQLGERKFVTTEWAEETTGRRERHTYRKEEHASPVNSPPRSPVLEEISDATIPMGFPETDTRAVALEPRSRRKKCLLNPNRCRAFWDHSLNECWIPYSEQPTRPEQPVKWPIQAIDAPKDVSEGGADGYLPTLGIPVYRSRLSDHYGLMFPNTPTDKTPERPQWPRIGIRVPYEPMTFEDLRICREDEGAGGMEAEASKSVELMDIPETSNPEKVGKILAPDAHLRGVHEVRSIAVPIIAQPQRPWADLEEEPDEDDSGSGSGSDAESDDEGDLFHESYITGSFPGGMPAPAIPPTGALETTVQDETAPASIAPEAAVPAADNQEGGNAEDL
ncbi:hypothetical protein J4E81_005330 [Alternaria sp. BMP 2799]|nr:hypothetical protein J4E81_005330 [Alternaria sp. BMP 2799]